MGSSINDVKKWGFESPSPPLSCRFFRMMCQKPKNPLKSDIIYERPQINLHWNKDSVTRTAQLHQ